MPSSHIASHSYDPATRRMTITFTNGDPYTYENVPQVVATGFERAISKGSYFHRFIKSRPTIYPAKKVEKK